MPRFGRRRLPHEPHHRPSLLVQKDKAGAVDQLQVALDRPTFDTDGQILVTPAVATAELDTMRQQGRRLLDTTR